MTIKTILIARKSSEESVYPFLGITKENLVVLFREDSSGTVISPGERECHKIGYYSNSWFMRDFTKYYGEVIMKSSLDNHE